MLWNPDILSQGEIHALREAAERAWGDDTRHEHYKGSSRSSAGQCHVTSAWLKTRLGGSLGRVGGHYVWLSPDHTHVLDLTGDQFGQDQIMYKQASHPLFEGVEPVDDIDDPEINSRTQAFITRANREYDQLGSRISKIALDYAGDAYPAEEPQRDSEIQQERGYWHEPPAYEPGKGEYQFVYGNGELEISPFHDHTQLAEDAGIELDSSGPFAVGYASVDAGMAHWSVYSNVGGKSVSKILKEYGDQVGWKWGGMTDLEGEPVGTGSEFAPKKSRFRFIDGQLFIGSRDADLVRSYASNSEYPEKSLGESVFGILYEDEDVMRVSRVVQGPNFFYSVHRDRLAGLIEALQEYASDRGFMLVADDMSRGKGGIGDNVIKRIEDLDTDNIYSPEMNQEDRQFFPKGVDHDREPSGAYKCKHCGALFPTWRAYALHLSESEGPGEEPNPEDSGFPETEMDAEQGAIPNHHFTPQQPEVFPIASVKEARRVDGFVTYASAFGCNNDDHRHYVAYRAGSPVGVASIDENSELKLVHVNEPVTHHLMNKIRSHYGEINITGGRNFTESWLKHAEFIPVTADKWVWSKTAAGSELLEDEVPFIYDIQEDSISIGHPGTKTSEIPGRFTPGGILEGTYAPNGKVYLRSMTNMPYSVRHLIDLWYWQHPHLEVKNVIYQDDEGKERKLATRVIEEQTVGEPRPTNIYRLDQRRPWVYDLQTDTVHLGQPGTHHDEIPVDWDDRWLQGYATLDGEIDTFPNPYLAKDAWAKETAVNAVRRFMNNETTDEFKFAAAEPRAIAQYVKTRVIADPAAARAWKSLTKAGGEVFAVGGAVRDAAMGREPKDIDLMVTGLPPDQVEEALNQDGRVDLTGKDFGVFRLRSHGEEVEVALPRRERSTGDEHRDFDIQSDHTMKPEEDLYRRDFTVNAMAVNLNTNELLDPYGGLGHVDENKLTTVHDHALSEDPLRVVRGLVARGRHGFEPDEGTRAQMAANSEKLLHLPQERIQAELDKLMKSADPAAAVRLAHETGTLKYILPEVDEAFGFDQNNSHHELELGEHLLAVLERTAKLTDDPDVRLAALLHDIGKPGSAWTDPETGKFHFYKNKEGQGENHEELGAQMAEKRLRDLHYPEARIKKMRDLVAHHMFPAFTSPKGARKFVNTVGDYAEDLMNIREGDNGGKSYKYDPQNNLPTIDRQREMIKDIRSQGEATDRSGLAINGNDLLSLGYQGREIGDILERLTRDVIDNPDLNTKDSLLELAQNPGHSAQSWASAQAARTRLDNE